MIEVYDSALRLIGLADNAVRIGDPVLHGGADGGVHLVLHIFQYLAFLLQLHLIACNMYHIQLVPYDHVVFLQADFLHL